VVNALKILHGSNAIDMFLSTKTDAQYIFFDMYFSRVGFVLSSDFALIYFHHEYKYTGTSL
jgi:hypothetical protein